MKRFFMVEYDDFTSFYKTVEHMKFSYVAHRDGPILSAVYFYFGDVERYKNSRQIIKL